MTEKKIKLDYSGSKPWLVFWVLLFFPVALVLLATSGKFTLDEKNYHVKYGGSRNWLCFWVIAMFPIAFILMLLNGLSLVAEQGLTNVHQNVPIV